MIEQENKEKEKEKDKQFSAVSGEPESSKLPWLPDLIHEFKIFKYQKADDKIFVCKFSKNVKSKLYYIENSKTREQTE